MLQSQKIKELRTSGELAQALELALLDLAEMPDNIYAKRNISWVYYAMLKKQADDNSLNDFLSTLSLIKELQLPVEEKMLFNNLAFPIAKMFRNLAGQQPIDYSKANNLYQSIQNFHFEKPLLNYSVLLGGLQKVFKDSHQYLNVIDWWGLENLRQEDFLEEEYNSKKFMALAEQVYIGYAKHLEMGKPLDAYGNNTEIDKSKIEEFLPKLEAVIEKYPNYVYPAYFKAKLLIKLGDDDILSTFIPFAKKKKNDYWVWQLMAEIHKDQPDIVLSSYCKALTLKTPDEFLVKIRQNLAGELIKREFYAEAKTEIKKILIVKEKTKTKIPSKIQMWQNTEWYKNSKSNSNNNEFYNKFADKAEEILFHDLPEEVVVVEYVNYDKYILNFIKNKDKNGFFKYLGLIDNPQIGDVLDVRFSEDSTDKLYRAMTAKFSVSNSCEAIKIFSGNIRVIPSGIGFLEDCFIEKKLIEQFSVKDGDEVRAKAIISFNKSKNEWGWKACGLKR